MMRTRIPQRGFLLLVIVGLLAVMLALVIGFLSFTRAQAASVTHVRDRTDAIDLAQSAMDFAISNIAGHVIDPATNKFDPNKFVSNANDDTSAGGGQWWYTPYEPGVKTRAGGFVNGYASTYMQQKEAVWKYMPDDFFPEGGIKGRFCVQVVDANSAININDWNEDCNPTQCQMAHMLEDGTGIMNFEPPRSGRENNWNNQPAHYRYQQAWRMATRTTRYLKFNWSYTGDYQLISPNHITTNTSWFGMLGPEYHALNNFFYDETMWADWYYRVGILYSLRSGADPDTGRCPLNVNTCEVSGNNMPFTGENNTWAFTLEGIFNTNSLARVVNVGKFWFDHDNNSGTPDVVLDAMNPDAWSQAPLNMNPANIDRAWRRVEKLKMKLAFWYQEMMVRYLCGKYKPYSYGMGYLVNCLDDNIWNFWGYWHNKFLFRWNDNNSFKENRTYYQAFGYNSTQPGEYFGALEPAEANKVKHAYQPDNSNPPDEFPQSAYYKTTRFPVSVQTFRQYLAEDLVAMTQNNNNWTAGVVCNPWLTQAKYDPNYWAFLKRYDVAGQTAAGITPDGELAVNFDKKNVPEIIPGKLDKRTANAIFDNIIPGKVWKDSGGAERFLLFENDGRLGVRDPLWELYSGRVGRDEYAPQAFNRKSIYVASGADKQYNEQGRDIDIRANGPYEHRPKVPWRQLAFTPDSFSTELTTTSNTFWIVVTTQVVDAKSSNLADPTVKTWYQQLAIVEIAPDIEVDTDPGYDGSQFPAAGAAANSSLTLAQGKRVGLGYYRGNWPKKIKTMKPTDPGNAAPDFFSMDDGMKTVFEVNTLGKVYPALPDTKTLTPPSNNTSSVGSAAPDWIDYRGVKDADAGAFYKEQGSAVNDKGRQTTKRVLIKQIWTINQGI